MQFEDSDKQFLNKLIMQSNFYSYDDNFIEDPLAEKKLLFQVICRALADRLNIPQNTQINKDATAWFLAPWVNKADAFTFQWCCENLEWEEVLVKRLISVVKNPKLFIGASFHKDGKSSHNPSSLAERIKRYTKPSTNYVKTYNSGRKRKYGIG